MEDKFLKIKKIAEKELSHSDHDMDHVMRVYNLALRLAENEEVDLDVLKAATLLHDIARAKEDNDNTGNTDHAVLGAKMAAPILKNLGFPEEKIRKIQDCIVSHRYRTGNEPKSMEAKILFDADKLDSLGAIGIARAFVWVGRHNAKIYSDENIAEYVKNNLGGEKNGKIQDKTKHSPQVEFETKLKFIKEKLHTQKAREICEERTEFVKNFLDSLEKEIKGGIE